MAAKVSGGEDSRLIAQSSAHDDLYEVEGNTCSMVRNRSPLLFWCAITVPAVLLAALLVVGGLYIRLEEEGCMLPPASPVDDSNDDFPIWVQQPWDIETHNQHIESFTAQSTTWSHLDLSPNGDMMVFDAVGDLFLLPLDPKTALPASASESPVLLLGGVAWAREPKFNALGTVWYWFRIRKHVRRSTS